MPRTGSFKSAKKPRSSFKSTKMRKAKKPSKVSKFQEVIRTAEVKNIDLVAAATPLPATGWAGPTLLNAVAQGIGNQQRVGRRYTTSRVQYRLTANTSGAGLRVLIVYDRQPNGVAPTITDILPFNDVNSFMSLTNSDRFLVISDKQWVPGKDGNIGGGPGGNVYGMDYIKCSLDTVCSTAGGTIADVSTGAFWIMAAQLTAGTPAAGVLNLTTRLRYTDV